MTAIEFIRYLRDKFGIGNYPTSFRVDPVTYANVCQYLFGKLASDQFDLFESKVFPYYEVYISLGIAHKGIMLLNVEIVLSHDGTDF